MWIVPDPPRPTGAVPLVSEADLATAWEERRYPAAGLTDSLGRRLQVVFPGRRWGGPGPDFRGAVLALADGTLIRGDIEVHRRSSSWVGHRHARDPAYRQVVLHVVQRVDGPTLDAAGRVIPSVVLAPPWSGLAGSPAGGVDGPCLRTAPGVVELVAAAGRERFRARAARFEADLAALGGQADQVLWRGLAEALGYSRNTRPFGLLAELVPWPQAAEVVREQGPLALAGLLLGTAGLLGQTSLAEAHAWRTLQRTRGARQALAPASWVRCQLRAGNAPAQRCRGLAALAARWTADSRAGPADQALDAVRLAAASRRPTLWRFARASPCIGRGRAQVIAVNVLLPLAAALGLATEAAMLFERLPGEPSNRVVRYMAAQLGAPQVRFGLACHQQGLIHLFKTQCAARLCEDCPARARGLSPR